MLRESMIKKKGLYFTAAVAVLSAFAQAQSPRERDVWFEYVQDGVRFGYRHVVVARQADGTFQYRVASKVQIDLFGSQKQEVVTQATYVVTSAFRPVSMRYVTTDMSGKRSVDGEVVGDALVLRVRRGDVVTERRLPCPADQPTTFSASLSDWLLTSGSRKTATIHEIDDEGGQLLKCEATRWSRDGAPFTIWQTPGEDGLGGRRFTFDADGGLESVIVSYPSMQLRRCPEDEAKKIVHRKMDGREVLTFPLDKVIPAPDRLRKLDVRLTWRDVPSSEFEFEDARQRVRESSNRSGLHSVVLELREPRPLDSSRRIPIEDAAMGPYLTETPFVKPTHPKIIAAARAAVGSETNAAAAVRILSKWVHGYIEGELSARTLTGPEVLESKRGKCTEYSTLFASMARALGIPTRLALGERMMAGQWMGHMWNEAFVGRWVTVDASVDEVDRSMVLLKFIHSDTVMGTQSVRWKLTRSLAIGIESFELEPSDLEGKYETGIVGRAYTNTDHACRITAAGDGWTLIDKTSPAAVTVQFELAGAKGVQIHFVAFALPAGTPAKLIIDNRIKMWNGVYEDFKTVASEACTVAGAAGHRSRLTGKTKSGMANATSEVVWGRGKSGYLINMISREADHAKHLPAFEKLVASFEFLDG